MWFLLLLFFALTEPIITNVDGNRMILRNGEHPCEGHVEIYYEGKRGYIGDKLWNEKTEEVVCRSAQCGSPKNSTYVPRLTDDPVWLNEVSCNGTETDLWECDWPGWEISKYRKEYVKKVTCSDEIKISLDGFRFAGAVQYTTNGKHSGYICDKNWRKEYADLLCKNLGGGTGRIPTEPFMVWNGFKSRSSVNKIIDCSGIDKVDNLWQCVTRDTTSCQSPAAVICEGHERLQLRSKQNACFGKLEKKEKDKWSSVRTTAGLDTWCQHLYCGSYASHTNSSKNIQLTCTDNITVDLMDKGESTAKNCYGAVYIKVNDTSHPVCATKEWTEETARVVCRELNCGDMVGFEKRSDKSKEGIMDYVSCTGTESSLWHCEAKRHQVSSKTFPCTDKISVICEASVRVMLNDGPGKCAGRVEIHHKGEWKKVFEDDWTDTNSDVVCRELGCGKKSIINSEKFSQGSSSFLEKAVNCNSAAKNISECIKRTSVKSKTRNAKGITCEEHKVLFLEDDKEKSCSGAVGIVKGSEIYWLSGSTDTWNKESADAVCQQMLCGEAKSFDSRPKDKMQAIWQESYNCGSNAMSLFACEKTTQPPNDTDTIATVSCTERTEVNLTNECWGNVNVCMNGMCGGVCADTWMDEKSKQLCENLGCGDGALPTLPTTPDQSQEVIFKSLHTTNHTKHLSQCNLVRYDQNDKTCSKRPASVICSGSIKFRISATRDKCSGNVEVQYGDQWLPVCTDPLNDTDTRNAICGELKCGHSDSKIIDYFGPASTSGYVISKIQRPGSDNKSLKNYNVTFVPATSPCNPAGIQCSDWWKMELEHSEKSCSGNVVVRSESQKYAVAFDGWTDTEGNKLCQTLDCGNKAEISQKPYLSILPLNRSFSCAGTESSIWDCEGQAPPSQQHLYVKCAGEPNITLSNTCHGKVMIGNTQVCSTGWSDDYSHLVCQELDCSNAFPDLYEDEIAEPNKDYYHVSCEKHHYKLGQCKRFKAKCTARLVSVNCVKSVSFTTSERCGGQIRVSYGKKKEEKVCPTQMSVEFKNKLCENINCGGHNASIRRTKTSQKENLRIKLNFSKNCKDIKHSVQLDGCKNSQPAEIYCYGYIEPRVEDKKVEILPIVLGVGAILVLVILIVVFIRLYITRRAKSAMNFSSEMSSRKEDEFESGEYEDVLNKDNEMEENRGRFRSESEMIMQSDARSTTSLNYDDIDEVTEAQPLTSGGGASGNNYMQKGALDHSDDGVTYEVDDPQENYDDIEAPPEINQTTAEVHDSPQPIPESVTGAQLLVQGDEDYLVPGQDG